MRFGIVVFPGSNCDRDCLAAVRACGYEGQFIWHQETSIPDVDCIILPGGFAHGDYLRTGAIARFSPIMSAVVEKAERGLPIMGICNGFQVLLESGLLPGAMLRNASLKFVCAPSMVRVETSDTPFTFGQRTGDVLMLPIAHGEGNYYADPDTIRELESCGQVVFRYSSPTGEVSPEDNPNGSIGNIAGICNKGRNVLGLMPHPERAAEEILGGSDGRRIFHSVAAWAKGGGCRADLRP